MKSQTFTTMPIVLCLTALLCIACGSGNRELTSPSHGITTTSTADAELQIPTIRIATSSKIASLDPITQGFWFTEFGAAELPLILGENFTIKPWVLKSFAQIDNLNWRLTLRPNVTFQNGKLLTAAALAAAMNRQLQLSPSTKGLLPDASVKVTGEHEVVLTTSKPNPNVPAALAEEGIFPVYDVETVEAVGNDFSKLAGTGCYTGPYQITNLTDEELLLERYASYWQGRPPLRGVSVRFVRDAQARILAVQNDEVDVALYPPTEAKRTLANRTDAFFVTGAAAGGSPRIFLNTRIAPFNDTSVRRAFSFGIDYKSLAEEVLDGAAETATGFYPSIFSWAIQNQFTDVEKAKQLLDAAGWRTENLAGVRSKNGTPLEVVFLIYPQRPDFPPLATAIQAQLKQIGFRILIRQVDDINAAMRESTGTWNAGIISPGVVTLSGTPDPLLRDYLTTKGTRNFGGVSNAELDELVDELERTFDSTRRTIFLKRIQKIVIEENAYEVRPIFSRAKVIVGKAYQAYKPSPQLYHLTYATQPSS